MSPPKDEKVGIMTRKDTKPRNGEVWCALPVYNNADTVQDVASRCRKFISNVLIIDDGSEDADLREMFSDTDIEVVRHAANRGKGEALRTAFHHIYNRNGAFMIALDADGQHYPEDIPLFIDTLDDNAIILGARNKIIGEMPFMTRFGWRLSDFCTTIETGQSVNDTQSGFRAYPVRNVAQLPFRCSRYDFETEVLARAAWEGAEFRSVSVRAWYPPPDERVTSFCSFMDNLRITLTHTRLLARRLLLRPHKRNVSRHNSIIELIKRPSKLFKKRRERKMLRRRKLRSLLR